MGNTNHRQRQEELVISDLIARASSPGYDKWWSGVTASGYCTSPIHLSRNTSTGKQETLVKCKNRRADICPTCSDLYAGDTWQIVHSGIGGGHNIPATVANHPLVFVTLTAPSFGKVHSAPYGRDDISMPCHPKGSRTRCPHGASMGCGHHHATTDVAVGQPLCAECYDYAGQVLFTWHAPELWARFAINLRRAIKRELATRGEPMKSIRVSFVKIVEMQRRGVPHFHAVIRLDDATSQTKDPKAPASGINADDLVALAKQAARAVHLTVPSGPGESVKLKFGQQCDVKVLNSTAEARNRSKASGDSDVQQDVVARRIAGYLAKYVTKSVTDFGLMPRPFSPEIIPTLDVSNHVRQLLGTITELSDEPGREAMTDWLHTLGYRGHITTKSRQYSVTMGSLRETRAEHARNHATQPETALPMLEEDSVADWKLTAIGHNTTGERFLVHSAALKAKEARWTARQLTDQDKLEDR